MHGCLLSLWVTGALLLLPLCWGDQDSYEVTVTVDYDDDYITPTPDYDYNATFDYMFYNNSSHEIDYGLYEILGGDKGPVAEDTRSPGNTASGIGLLSPVLLLGLAAQHITV